MRVGVIGVGIMGSAMATNLLEAGHDVTGFDVDEDRTKALEPLGLIRAPNAVSVAARSEVTILSLPSADALDKTAAELASADLVGRIVIETGTLPLETKERARALLAENEIVLLDATLSGTGLQARDATLVVFASGPEDAVELVRPVFDSIARSTHYLGEFGNGSRMKYIANLLVAIHNLATAEAHALGIAAGMDPATVQRVMEDGVGSSKIFEIRGPMMVEDDYPPAARLDIILKDSLLISDFARSVGAPTPLLDAALDVYRSASLAGLGGLDAAALCRYLERAAGLSR